MYERGSNDAKVGRVSLVDHCREGHQLDGLTIGARGFESHLDPRRLAPVRVRAPGDPSPAEHLLRRATQRVLAFGRQPDEQSIAYVDSKLGRQSLMGSR